MLVFGNYGDITNSPDRLAEFTTRINRAYDKLATKIMSVDGRWQFDDASYTTAFPIGETDLISGQQDYTMDVEFMDVVKVLALDTAGNKRLLEPFDINDPIARPFLEGQGGGGMPSWYDKTGSSILLYPIPNYNATNGLIVHYRRPPSYFVSTDTTKSAGVPAIFHRYLSLEASLDYAITKQLSQKNDLATRLKEYTDNLEDFYSKRSKDESKFLIPPYSNPR